MHTVSAAPPMPWPASLAASPLTCSGQPLSELLLRRSDALALQELINRRQGAGIRIDELQAKPEAANRARQRHIDHAGPHHHLAGARTGRQAEAHHQVGAEGGGSSR